MYNIILQGIENPHEFEELIKVFLKPSEFSIQMTDGEKRDKYTVARELFLSLSEMTGKRPDWGVLTGVRPVKLAGDLMKSLKDREKAKQSLIACYLLSEEKADLLLDIYAYQQQILEKPQENTVGLYIGIPFCPTRCLYCSFPASQASESQIQTYLHALSLEIEFVASSMKAEGITPESIYIGGGTPTTLDPKPLQALLEKTVTEFDLSTLKEFTVEAGRPDTITAEKLEVIRKAGASRISINPQSMQGKTLDLIGRSHTPENIKTAFWLAREIGISMINMDIIAGLPGEIQADFEDTLRQVIELNPENITVHTLATKRASKLVEMDKNYHYKQGEIVRGMLEVCRKQLPEKGYRPYYLYRQKQMAGNFENIGWCKEGSAGIYNIRIMEEAQTIIALGAGGITKVYYPDENRLERVPNVSNFEIYSERLDEMIQRKRNQCFHF